MNRTEFTDFVKAVFNDDILKLNDTKGNDYAGSEDVFRNFTSNGERLGLRPEQIWAVYFSKHIDAIITYTKDGSVKSEPIEGRIDDAIMYLLLLRGMVASENQLRLTESVSRGTEAKSGEGVSFHKGKHGADALKAAGDKVSVTVPAPVCTCPAHYTTHSATCPKTLYNERVARGKEADNGGEFKPSPKPRS